MTLALFQGPAFLKVEDSLDPHSKILDPPLTESPCNSYGYIDNSLYKVDQPSLAVVILVLSTVLQKETLRFTGNVIFFITLLSEILETQVCKVTVVLPCTLLPYR